MPAMLTRVVWRSVGWPIFSHVWKSLSQHGKWLECVAARNVLVSLCCTTSARHCAPQTPWTPASRRCRLSEIEALPDSPRTTPLACL